MDKLSELLHALAVTRKALDTAKEQESLAKTALENTKEYALYQEAKLATADAKEAERAAYEPVRDCAIASWSPGSPKKIHPNVTINCRKSFIIVSKEDVLDYCIKSYHAGLSIDRKMVKEIAHKIDIPGTLVGEETTAKVDTDLSHLLETTDEPN